MAANQQLKKNISHLALVFLLALMPISIMLSISLPSIIYYLSLITSVLIIFSERNRHAKKFYQNHKWLLIAMASPLIITIFAALWHGFISSRDLETSLRFFLSTWLILLALQYIPTNIIKNSIWGFVVAAIAGSTFIFYIAWPDWSRPNTKEFYNAVIYGNLLFALIVTVLFSLKIKITKWQKTEFVIKSIVTVFSFIAFVVTQTRTTWMAVPACAIIAAFLLSKQANFRRIAILGVLFIGIFAAIFISDGDLRQRAVKGYNEVVQCHGEGKNTESSLCIRLQLWRASIDMAIQRPIAGTGDEKLFTEYLQNESLPKGIVTPYVSKWWEPHSDIMLSLATFGWLGGISKLLIYLAPAILFLRRMSFKKNNPERAAAAIGLAICVAFGAAGFGDTMFRSMRIASFYAMALVLFLRLSQSESDIIKND